MVQCSDGTISERDNKVNKIYNFHHGIEVIDSITAGHTASLLTVWVCGIG